jgi:Domain of unknown function (DUF4252)
MRLATILVAVALAPAWGQKIKPPEGMDRLAAKAEETIEVTMDKAMLKLAGRFLSDRGDEAKARKVLEGLESIYVRSFTFGKEGDYNPADIEAFRAQFQTAEWSRVVGLRSTLDGENVDVFLKSGTNGEIGGAVVIAAEPRELTIVQISGTLDPDQLADLSGQFHIPHLAMSGRRTRR